MLVKIIESSYVYLCPKEVDVSILKVPEGSNDGALVIFVKIIFILPDGLGNGKRTESRLSSISNF